MKDTPLNVVFLGVDALRPDRLSLFGYDRPTSPTLDRLAESSLVCERAFSLAPFTQPASIQTMTSSRPFSFGGYDTGAFGRPDTLFKRFHQAGYRTHAISPLHWVNRYFGYGEGLDVEVQLFTLNTIAGVVLATTRSTLEAYAGGEISADKMLAIVGPPLEKLFGDCGDYCRYRISHEKEFAADFPDSLLVNAHYDFDKVQRVVARHKSAFEADRLGYIETHLARLPVPRAHEWLGRDWYYCRKPGKLVSEAVHRMVNGALKPFNPALALARQNRFKSYVDAGAIADKVIATIRNRDAEKPFFLWAHFMDTHLPYVSGRGQRWWKETPRYLRALGHSESINPARTFDSKRPGTPSEWEEFGALYDAAILWTDAQIGRIVSALEDEGMMDNTLLVIAGDHGEELGEHGNLSHYFLPYEHSIRTPLIFHRGGTTGATIGGFVTLMDIAPSMTAMAGIDPVPEWEGLPVQDSAIGKRRHILAETFYGGNCAFDDRPLYFGLRTDSHKFIWKEYRDPKDWQSLDGHELYDLRSDPDEQENLYRPDHPLLPEFNRIIAQRMAEIPEVTQARIDAAFGDDLADPARRQVLA